MSIGTLFAGSHFVTAGPSTAPNLPPFWPENTASSALRCASLARLSRYKRAVPLPAKKLPGHQAASAARQPSTSWPSTPPFSMSISNAPAHQPWSGTVSGPSQHGHNALQLHISSIVASISQVIVVSFGRLKQPTPAQPSPP